MTLSRATNVAFFLGGGSSFGTHHTPSASFFRGEFSWRFKRERVDEVVVVVVVVVVCD